MSENKVRYRSGNLTFNNKVLAFEHHYAYNTDKVSFEFANGTFDTCDFSQEPTESFDELCKQRALQIRDSTSYLAIMLSGGSDSNHLLDCFVRNNIKIDEIVMLRDGIHKISNQPHPQNWEIDNLAIPFVKNLNPNCKITIHDTSTDLKDLETFLDYDSQFLYNRTDGYDATIINWLKFQKLRPELTFTCGSGEPLIGYDVEADKYYSVLYDTNNLRWRTHITSNFMPFYVDPMFPKLHIKQCHMIKNYFRENGHEDYIKDDESYLPSYKDISIRLTRYNSIDTSVSPFYYKRKQSKEEGLNFAQRLLAEIKVKSWIDYLNNMDPSLVHMYVDSLKQTIDNFPLYALPVGVPIYKKKYLE